MKSRACFSLLCLGIFMTATAAYSQSFLYLSDQRIVTVEQADEESLIVNYINLGDSFEVLAAHQLVLLDSEGQVYRGHLFREENPEDPSKLFKVTHLVRPGEFSGYVVTGKFDLRGSVARVLLRVSSRILELESLTPRQFELVASRIGELDLGEQDRKLAVQLAGFRRGYGTMIFSGSVEASDVERYFPDDGVIPPLAMKTPLPRLPSSESDLRDPVVVRVKATVSRSGGLMNISLSEGINAKLDQIALQTVQNSWVFLPAISDNELAEAEVTLNVVFQR